MLIIFAVGGGLTGILPLILIIAAIILFGIATFWTTSPVPSGRLVSGGLFCWALAVLLQMVGGL